MSLFVSFSSVTFSAQNIKNWVITKLVQPMALWLCEKNCDFIFFFSSDFQILQTLFWCLITQKTGLWAASENELKSDVDRVAF